MKLALTITLLALTGCIPVRPADTRAETSTVPGTTSYRVLQTGAYGAASEGDVDNESGRRAPFVEIASDAKRYAALWSQYIDDKQPPSIDFAKESAVFLLLPPRATGGYAILVRDVTLDGSTATVAADLQEPKAGQMVTQAFTAPFAVLAVAKANVRDVEWMNQGRLLARRTAE